MPFKFIKTAGLCLASMLLMGMALAGTASAAVPLWLLCLEGKEGSLPTKYETNQCRKAASGNEGKWESVALGEKSDTVRILVLTLRLTDTKATLGKATIVCDHVKGIGLIEKSNLLIAREAKVPHPEEECAGTEGFTCKGAKPTKVEGADLPWKVELYTEKSGKFVSRIQPDGSGEPGWKVECAGTEDVCLSTGAGTLEETSGENVLTVEGTKSTLLVLAEILKVDRRKSKMLCRRSKSR